MADKYIRQNAGILTETEAATNSAGAGDAGKIVALDGTGRLDSTLMPVGIGADTSSIEASEALNAGDFVNIWDDAGVGKVRKADASTTGKEANGFVLDAVASGNAATVYWEGINTQVSGLTPGTAYLSSSTPGAATNTPPSTSGAIIQRLGKAIDAATIAFEASQPIALA